MTSPTESPNTLQVVPINQALSNKRRARVLGLTLDEWIKTFFGGNALVAVVVLFLIMFLLFKEGLGFVPMNVQNLRVYRQAGLEFVDYFRGSIDDYSIMSRYLNEIRLKQLKALQIQGKSLEEINASLAAFDSFKNQFDGLISEHEPLLSEMSDLVTAIKERVQLNVDHVAENKNRTSTGEIKTEAQKVATENIDFVQETAPLKGMLVKAKDLDQKLATNLTELAKSLPVLPVTKESGRLSQFPEWVTEYSAKLTYHEQQMEAWNPLLAVPAWKGFTSFIFGSQWLTASFWQDWYGIIPIFVGSALISVLALCIAVPFGIGAAIYVNQVASFREQNFIKPYIEFISAIPSVVLGFFGIAVLGTFIRDLSNWDILSWVPFFPIVQRLNIFTAGALLGLMAIPTIFTLAEDALNNVPRYFVEASTALGATRFQTIIKIMVPAALSGIISAVLLGLGRVIGETMVVLLCAGNRIQIPDFSQGLGALFQPAHTMTGMIAQEMGEVAHGTIHYRALFMVGIVLFFISLALNYAAQWFVRRYKISIG